MTYKFTPLLSLCLLLVLSTAVQAQISQFLEYEYDAAGNIIRITRSVVDTAPEVTVLTPALIRLNQSLMVTATGAGLLGVSVTSDHPKLTVSNVFSTPGSARFSLSTSATTPLGLHTLSFSTSLGSTTASIEVIPDQPDLRLFPAPVAAPNTGAPVTLIVELQTPDVTDHVIDLSVGNPGIATISPSSVTIPVGQLRPTEAIQVTGRNNGSTTLTLQSPLLDTYRTMVFVAPPLALTAGNYSANARPLGIRRGEPAPPTLTLNPLFSPLLGIVRQTSPSTTSVAPILAPLLGVSRTSSQNESVTISPLLSPLLGVSRPSSQSSSTTISPLLAPMLGVQRDTGTPTGTVVNPLVAPLLGVERATL